MLNTLLLAVEVVLYFGVMATLFRFRHRFGIGTFICALGAMHFLETYLAAILYLQFPYGIVISPGSTVLFTGKVLMLLLVYIREDARTARQPIYGLLFGNLLVVALVFLMRHHDVVPIAADRLPDYGLMDEMGWLMLWGSVLLFIDAILIILVYEQSASWFGQRTTLRVLASAFLVLTFDQVGFYLALKLAFDAPFSVLLGGWAGKMVTSACFSGLIGCYLAWIERQQPFPGATPRIADVLETLTYRQRYEDLLARSGRDGLTGFLNRDRFEADGALLVREAVESGSPFSLLVIDIDHFKSVNDRFGHAAGDRALHQIARVLSATLRGTDCIYRFGGEEFVVLCPGLTPDLAARLAERLRLEVAKTPMGELGRPITVSIGVAGYPADGRSLERLFASADARLYRAKDSGRDRVWGGDLVPWVEPDALLA